MAPPNQGRTEALEKFTLPQDPITEGNVEIDPDGIRIEYEAKTGQGKFTITVTLRVSSPYSVFSAQIADKLFGNVVRWNQREVGDVPPQWVTQTHLGAFALLVLAMRSSPEVREDLIRAARRLSASQSD